MSMKAEGAEANANAGNMVANAESAEDKWGIKEFNFVLIPGEDTEKIRSAERSDGGAYE